MLSPDARGSSGFARLGPWMSWGGAKAPTDGVKARGERWSVGSCRASRSRDTSSFGARRQRGEGSSKGQPGSKARAEKASEGRKPRRGSTAGQGQPWLVRTDSQREEGFEADEAGPSGEPGREGPGRPGNVERTRVLGRGGRRRGKGTHSRRGTAATLRTLLSTRREKPSVTRPARPRREGRGPTAREQAAPTRRARSL